MRSEIAKSSAFNVVVEQHNAVRPILQLVDNYTRGVARAAWPDSMPNSVDEARRHLWLRKPRV